MSSYLNCIVEINENNTWKPLIKKVFSHFYADTRDIVIGTGNYIDYDFEFNEYIPNDISDYVKDNIPKHATDIKWLDGIQFRQLLEYIYDKKDESIDDEFELSILLEVIKELEFVESSIDFAIYGGVDFEKVRIIFFVD